MQKWANNIKNVQDDERVKQAIIAANNHYAGFGPGTANLFRICWDCQTPSGRTRTGSNKKKSKSNSSNTT